MLFEVGELFYNFCHYFIHCASQLTLDYGFSSVFNIVPRFEKCMQFGNSSIVRKTLLRIMGNMSMACSTF